MKIKTVFNRGTEYDDDADYSVSVELTTDTATTSVSFGEGEPEDMSLARDLNDVYSIPGMLRAAYEAGKRGETLKIIEEIEKE